ncbi:MULTISPECIES: lysylphosphatidylglycerol synthase transmembrane domain-containing protein [unclassified Rhizobium]|uniref:lysylphosphatidylglycerol synthase transmembrane domain-containing protein n=1 Tax=unclassified Rhizobium TaxID=2613769 RepID=UPI000761F9D2|nr:MULTISPECIES: lysylphosphatidylglycerol synthase transmembrane domain-containing protein [unclassified Rhizobium]
MSNIRPIKVADQTAVTQGRAGRTIRVGLGVIVGVGFVYLAMRNVSFDEVVTLLAGATLAPLLLAVLAFVADFFLRAVRFWMMLQSTSGRHLPLRLTIGPFIASFGMSDVLPLRVGDAFRILWFSRQFSIPAGTVMGTMLVERILDLVTIAFLGGVALAMVDLKSPPALVWNCQLLLVIALAGGSALLFAPALLCRLLERFFNRVKFAPVVVVIAALRAASQAVTQISSWRSLVTLTVMSIALWLLESVVFLGAWVSLGGAIDVLLKPFLAFAFSTLGTLVPSLPGHFGPFEFFGLQAFALAGVETGIAAAVVLLAHLILWAPTALFGVGWLMFAASRAPDATRRAQNAE